MKVNTNLNPATLRKATQLAELIEQKQAELQALLSGEPSRKVSKCGKTDTRTLEQRAAISAGLKASWAARKATKDAVPQTILVP
jgi:hypothetical protein